MYNNLYHEDNSYMYDGPPGLRVHRVLLEDHLPRGTNPVSAHLVITRVN